MVKKSKDALSEARLGVMKCLMRGCELVDFNTDDFVDLLVSGAGSDGSEVLYGIEQAAWVELCNKDKQERQFPEKHVCLARSLSDDEAARIAMVVSAFIARYASQGKGKNYLTIAMMSLLSETLTQENTIRVNAKLRSML